MRAKKKHPLEGASSYCDAEERETPQLKRKGRSNGLGHREGAGVQDEKGAVATVTKKVPRLSQTKSTHSFFREKTSREIRVRTCWMPEKEEGRADQQGGTG